MSNNQSQNMQVDDEITKLLKYTIHTPPYGKNWNPTGNISKTNKLHNHIFSSQKNLIKNMMKKNDEEKNDHHTQQITATHGQCTYSYQYESIQEENFYDTHDGLLEGELAELRNFTKDHQQQHNHELPQHKDPTKPFKTCWKSEYSSNGRFEITADWKIRRWNLLQPNSQLHL